MIFVKRAVLFILFCTNHLLAYGEDDADGIKAAHQGEQGVVGNESCWVAAGHQRAGTADLLKPGV